MTHPQILAVRKAVARQSAADVVIELGDPDSEPVQLLESYRDASVLQSSQDAPDLLIAGLAQIVAEAKLVPAKSKTSTKSAAKKKKAS